MPYPGTSTYPGSTTFPGGGASLGNNTLPACMVEVNFAGAPAAPVVNDWRDVSPFVAALSIRRGRQDEDGRDEAGTATVLLLDDNRDFDPTNASGRYWPNVVPMRRVRISLRWGTTSVGVFHGFAESFAPRWEGETGQLPIVELRCVDLFKSLVLTELDGPSYPQEVTGSRINNVLNTIGWPATERNVATGAHTVGAETIASVDDNGKVTPATAVGSVKTYLDSIVDAERGRLFVDGDGKVVFQDSRYRMDVTTTSQATLSDADGAINYPELATEYDDALLANDVIVTHQATEQHPNPLERVNNASSITKYLRRSLSLSTRIIKPGEAAAVASYYLWRRKEARFRAPSVSLRPVANEWNTILPLLDVLSDRITVRRQPPQGGSAIQQEVHVEGFSLSLSPYVATVSLDVSPADVLSEWISGTSTYGVNTIVGI